MSWEIPTDELQERLQLVGRPIDVYTAVLHILRANLPALIQAVGLVPTERLPQVMPKRFQFAGEELPSPDNPAQWPVILVAGAVRTTEFTHGWQNEIQVNITAAWPGPRITRRQFQDSADLVTLAAGIFRHEGVAGAFADPDNPTRILWYAVVPSGYSLVPADWPHYQGYIAHLVFNQAPGSGLWPAPVPTP